ncbi:MAG: ribonuclease H-like domain-containing protein [Nanoarchaeota archaeon]|nr:ribonuclease H-like domain-containing protein [Nanoarchaeota archaeon]
MDHLIIDIETVPLELKDEVIREYLMDKQISKEMRSLNPLYSKIICICLKPKDKETVILSSDNEKELLEQFWSIVKDYHLFITHNGYGYDIPFIIIRSTINKIKPTININLNKFQMLTSNHFDTMLFFSQNSVFTNPRLDIVAKTCNIDIGDSRFDGREIERLYKEGKLDQIKQHCKEDVEITEKVYLYVKS